jgi:hypothetical protein
LTNPLSGEDSPTKASNLALTVAATSINSNSSVEFVTPTEATLSSSTVAVVSTKTSSISQTSTFPETAKWNVTSDGYVCILLQSAIRITLRYTVLVSNAGEFETL